MIRPIALVALAAALAGCGDRTPPAAIPPQATSAAAPAAAPTSRSPAAPVAATSPGTPDPDHPRLQVGLVDGGQFDLASHRGRWVVVNFWATWCGPCLKEMPELSKLAKRGDVDVVGLAYEDIETAAMQAFLAEHRPAYPVAIVDTFNPPADFESPRGLPMTVLVAPDGRLAKTIVGPVTIPLLDAAMAAHRARG